MNRLIDRNFFSNSNQTSRNGMNILESDMPIPNWVFPEDELKNDTDEQTVLAWEYNQRTGELIDHHGNVVSRGYSGSRSRGGRNNPARERERNIGPIPRAEYTIGDAFDSPNTTRDALPLTPMEGSDTYGRDALQIHGDSINNPGDASSGCIILPRDIRRRINRSNDRYLRVR